MSESFRSDVTPAAARHGLAYYNEHDRVAAAWLRELIKEGHIAPGIVDERSIRDVLPGDLAGFTQCHFFAGIGVWSRALRDAGWPDDQPVWTGSCPCQPFSSAGRGDGFDDQRHLWPDWFQLIAQCQPPVIFGEQVASKDGLGWLDLVYADLEAADYAVGAVDLCAAGVGAPHIRQRLWFVADAEGGRRGVVGDAPFAGRGGHTHGDGSLGDTVGSRLEGLAGHGDHAGRRPGAAGSTASAGGAGGLADTDSGDAGLGRNAGSPQGAGVQRGAVADGRGLSRTHWSDADWLPCRDGKWRPVEPGTFPLAHGIAARVGRLRGYGNAIVAPTAAAFISSYLTAQ